VGRRHELADVTQLLTTARLLTLTGPGGVGKTRLALRVAARVRRAFPDGIWLTSLADIAAPAGLAQAIATGIGLDSPPHGWPVSGLSRHIGSRQALLILDNCEHIAEACAVTADALLRACPQLRILATSRQALRAAGEAVYSVTALSLPDAAAPVSARALRDFDAIALFEERAQLASHGFVVDDANCAAVSRLCQQLEGVPLAIELAAARLRVLSLDEIIERLDDRYTLLSSSSRAGPARQQALRNLIDWSHDLCSRPEQLLWARLAVFAGGFDLAAVEAVCADDDLPVAGILDGVTSLLDKSILIREPAQGRARYRMLEMIRLYGGERLAQSGAQPAIRRRHRDYFLYLAGQAHAEWTGPDQAGWFARLQADQANVNAALGFSLSEPGEAEAALEMIVALDPYWLRADPAGERRGWVSQALRLTTRPTSARAGALRTSGWLCLQAGDAKGAAAHLAEVKVVAEQLGHPDVLPFIPEADGMIALFSGDLARAVPLFDEALAGFRAAGQVRGQLSTLYILAFALTSLGDSAGATARHQECVALADSLGERWFRSLVLWVESLNAWRQRDLGRAAALARESMRGMPLRDRLHQIRCVETLALIAADAGELQRAAVILGATHTAWRDAPYPPEAFAPAFAFRRRCEDQARAGLGGSAFDDAFRSGTQLTLEQAAGPQQPEDRPAGPPRRGSAEGLTRRERQIADLIALGKTNKEIAAMLVIAPRTAEGHVEHILAKLGFSSRARIAAWVAEGRPGPEAGEPASGPARRHRADLVSRAAGYRDHPAVRATGSRTNPWITGDTRHVSSAGSHPSRRSGNRSSRAVRAVLASSRASGAPTQKWIP
jgi:predicted ATPase/DNA-binding CsgD family transcriptional regulator